VARYLVQAALAVELVVEAEAMLAQDNKVDTRGHAEAQMAIALAKDDTDALQYWQQKVVSASA
jgi:hypothetical protein